MKRPKILLICHFSDNEIRSRLKLESQRSNNFLRRIFHLPPLIHADIAPWIPLFIKSFEQHSELEFHVFSFHYGMAEKKYSYEKNGIHYYFHKREKGFAYKLIDHFFHIEEKSNYKYCRKQISKIIGEISPNLIVLSGAENPFYSISALDVQSTPLFLIMQTLLNSPKRIEMGVGGYYRRKIEKAVIEKANFIATHDGESKKYAKEHSPNATIFDFSFPVKTIKRELIDKTFTFVFFARGITRFKGIEDVLRAFTIVSQTHPNITIEIIGGCDASYKSSLMDIIKKDGIENKVTFFSFFPSHEDALRQVQKSHYAVLPGITASINGTIKEAMLIGMPTIAYRTDIIADINKKEKCLFTAKMENVPDLAAKMNYVLENPEEAEIVAYNGRKFAEGHFTSMGSGELLVSLIHKSLNGIR